MHARRRHLHVLLSPLLCCYAKQKVLRVVCLFVVLSHVALQHGTVVVNSIDGPCRRVTVQAGLKGVELYDHRGDLGNDFNAWENVNLVSENTHTHLIYIFFSLGFSPCITLTSGFASVDND